MVTARFRCARAARGRRGPGGFRRAPADSTGTRRPRAAYAKTHKGAGSGARAAPCVGRSQPAWALA
ncbi:hypothetical protein WI47_08840 [Burkholderia cepacia]|nr:hypothetical protein WI47_08840 [Burkholderia cepacia]